MRSNFGGLQEHIRYTVLNWIFMTTPITNHFPLFHICLIESESVIHQMIQARSVEERQKKKKVYFK